MMEFPMLLESLHVFSLLSIQQTDTILLRLLVSCQVACQHLLSLLIQESPFHVMLFYNFCFFKKKTFLMKIEESFFGFLDFFRKHF